jgi:transposase
MRVKDVAKALDIHPFMLSRWKKEYKEGKIVADKRIKAKLESKQLDENKKICVLEKKIKALEIENDLLKKTIQFNLEKKKTSSNS